MRFPDDVPRLTSGDVTLRAHRLEDVGAVVEQCTDPASVRWTTVPLGYTAEDARRFVTETVPTGWESGSGLAFAIETTYADGIRRFGGTVSLRDEGPGRAEIAFGAHPGVRGRGVMTTAVNLLLDWGFEERGLETVIWWAERGNVGSRRVAWKTGFTFAGTVRRWLDHRGAHPDAWVASLHRDDSREPKTRWLGIPRGGATGPTLREIKASDVGRIVEGCSDPVTRHYLSFLPAPYQASDATDWMVRTVESASLGAGTSWAVADRDSDMLLGVVGLPRMGRAEAEVGYWVHPDARGRGVMTTAVRLVVRHAFLDPADGGLGLGRLFLKAAATNAASQQVARNNGFRLVGTERAAERLGDGTLDDLVVFDLLPAEQPTAPS